MLDPAQSSWFTALVEWPCLWQISAPQFEFIYLYHLNLRYSTVQARSSIFVLSLNCVKYSGSDLTTR